MSVIIYAAIPIFLVTLVIEWGWAHRRRHDQRIIGYARKDTLASLTMGFGNVVIAGFTKLVSFALMTWLYQHRVATLPNLWWTWVALFFAEDLCYYGFHRGSHEIRMLWAAHVNHHSSQHYNLSTALRQSWTTPFTGPWFWLVLPLLGFAPWMVVVQQAISLLYQYWIHTESIDRLPKPVEFLFNTPSHHRVHHGANPQYLDRNHGGILIIWDRLFGTFEVERERVVYGLTENIASHKPLVIAFHEWIAMVRDMRQAPTARAAFGYLLRPPGWRHDGKSKTARDVLADSQDPSEPAPLARV
jgi:sterol desaturase/sphingolipid hydroxylase (fatty acid hydroxylase superfamily)